MISDNLIARLNEMADLYESSSLDPADTRASRLLREAAVGLTALAEALQQAVGNLEVVSIYDGADEDDIDAVSARAAWQSDLSRYRAVLKKARGGDMTTKAQDNRP